MKRLVLLIPTLAIALLSLGGTWLQLSRFALTVPGPAPSEVQRKAHASGPERLRMPRKVRPTHPVYPYSVVPGGVYSEAEVRAAVLRHTPVAEHYAPVQLSQLRPVVLAQSRPAYVSYRRGDRIYWTAKPVQLRAGETVLSDGKEQIRARCGNRISSTPQAPVEAAGKAPTEAQMDQGVVVTVEAQGEATPDVVLETQATATAESAVETETGVWPVAANQVVAQLARATAGEEEGGGNFFPPLQVLGGGTGLGILPATPQPELVTPPIEVLNPPATTPDLPVIVTPPINPPPSVTPGGETPGTPTTPPDEPTPGENPPPDLTTIPRTPSEPERPPVVPELPDTPPPPGPGGCLRDCSDLPPVTPVPEPGTWMFLASGVGAVLVWRRRARS